MKFRNGHRIATLWLLLLLLLLPDRRGVIWRPRGPFQNSKTVKLTERQLKTNLSSLYFFIRVADGSVGENYIDFSAFISAVCGAYDSSNVAVVDEKRVQLHQYLKYCHSNGDLVFSIWSAMKHPTFAWLERFVPKVGLFEHVNEVCAGLHCL